MKTSNRPLWAIIALGAIIAACGIARAATTTFTQTVNFQHVANSGDAYVSFTPANPGILVALTATATYAPHSEVGVVNLTSSNIPGTVTQNDTISLSVVGSPAVASVNYTGASPVVFPPGGSDPVFNYPSLGPVVLNVPSANLAGIGHSIAVVIHEVPDEHVIVSNPGNIDYQEQYSWEDVTLTVTAVYRTRGHRGHGHGHGDHDDDGDRD